MLLTLVVHRLYIWTRESLKTFSSLDQFYQNIDNGLGEFFSQSFYTIAVLARLLVLVKSIWILYSGQWWGGGMPGSNSRDLSYVFIMTSHCLHRRIQFQARVSLLPLWLCMRPSHLFCLVCPWRHGWWDNYLYIHGSIFYFQIRGLPIWLT